MNVAEPVIRVKGLTKRFSLRRSWREFAGRSDSVRTITALDGVDLDIASGEVVGLLGANGAGKTTFVRILSTLLLPTAGNAQIMGCDVTRNPMAVRRFVGWCLDTERSFYYRLTGIQNLSFFAALNNVNSGSASARIKEVLELVGLGSVAHRQFRNYSRGMQQKLGLARALLTDPQVLLLDEPTKSLDPRAALEFRAFVRNVLSRDLKKTVLIVTHSLDEAQHLCDRLAFMDRGRIVAAGTWSQLESEIRRHGFQEETSGGE
jgi:ABC-2 type transport system ATP-binding protein